MVYLLVAFSRITTAKYVRGLYREEARKVVIVDCALVLGHILHKLVKNGKRPKQKVLSKRRAISFAQHLFS